MTLVQRWMAPLLAYGALFASLEATRPDFGAALINAIDPHAADRLATLKPIMAEKMVFDIAPDPEVSLCDTTTARCTQHSKTILLGRSTHDNTAYRYLPWQHKHDDCTFDGAFALGYEYQQTFKSDDLARYLFGRQTLSFKGSQVLNRNPQRDIIADYFGLSPLFEGTITFHPQIQNHTVHLESFFEFGGCVTGLYLRADMSFTHQKRSLYSNCCNPETDAIGTNTAPFPPGYMGIIIPGLATPVQPATTIREALQGLFTFGMLFSNAIFGSSNTLPPWRYGRFSCAPLTDNQIAGFSLDFGYDFIRSDCSHIGIFARYSAPTGTELNGSQKYSENFFFPIIGNGRHHELGGGLTAHKEFWSNDCGHTLTLYVDGYATHLFQDCQLRSFDFCNRGALSRYMLIEEALPFSTGALITQIRPFTSGINFTTRMVSSTISAQGDATLQCIYERGNFSLCFGYNIFGRTEEDLCIKPGIPCSAIDPNKSYGFKGCLGSAFFGYTQDASGNINSASTQLPLAATATQSATITSCGTTDNPLSTNKGPGNSVGVDWTNLFRGDGQSADAIALNTPVSNLRIAYLSNPQLTFSSDLTEVLDINSGRAARLLSQKGFITLNYLWNEHANRPYINIGCEVEGGNHYGDIKQWGLWLKGGVAF